MLWFWLWFLLVLGALVLLGLLAWRVFRKGMDVVRELGRVTSATGETSAASESAFDEWLRVRAEEDLADTELRDRDRSATQHRRPFGTEAARGPSSRRTMTGPDTERS